MRKTLLAASLLSLSLPATAAFADPPSWAPAHGRRAHEARGHHDHDRYHRPAPAYRSSYAYRAQPRYDHHGRYVTPQRLRPRDRVWQGDDGRHYCTRRNGTTGLIVGAAAGALLGRALDGGRERTLGTILGAAGGALLGRSIDRGELRCR